MRCLALRPATFRQPDASRASGARRSSRRRPSRRPVNTNYYRDWSIGSEFNKPVTEYPPFDPPPVIVAPRAPANRDTNRDMRRDVR